MVIQMLEKDKKFIYKESIPLGRVYNLIEMGVIFLTAVSTVYTENLGLDTMDLSRKNSLKIVLTFAYLRLYLFNVKHGNLHPCKQKKSFSNTGPA